MAKALLFDGVNDYAATTNSLIFPSAGGTMEAFFKYVTNPSGSRSAIIEHRVNSGNGSLCGRLGNIEHTKDNTVYSKITTSNASDYIPVGATGVSFRVGCNRTYNYTYIDCIDLAGAADAPTSLTVAVSKNGSNQFTTGAITTTAATYDNADFNADAGDLITVVVSNTTGVAGGVMVGLRWVRR